MSSESSEHVPPSRDHLRTTIAAIWLLTTGTLAYALLPAIVGSVAETPGFDDRSAGLIGAAQTLGNAAGLLIPTLAMTKFNLRRASGLALTVSVALNLLSMLALDPLPLTIIRFTVGAAEGVLIGIGVGVISSQPQTEARYAVSMVAQFTSGALIFYNLPMILGIAGFRSLVAVFLVLPALTPLILRWVPERAGSGIGAAASRNPNAPLLSRDVVLTLVAFGLFYAVNGGSWAYAERIGAVSELTLEMIGTALSLSMLGGIGGSVMATVLAGRISRTWNILLAGMIGVASVLLLTLALDFSRFALAVILINFSVGFAAPFYIGILADRDRTGRMGSFAALLNLGASGIGPAAAALLVSHGYDTLLYSAAVIYMLGYLIVLPVLLRVREDTE